jgi:hypothetical protein
VFRSNGVLGNERCEQGHGETSEVPGAARRGSRHARVWPGRCTSAMARLTSFLKLCWSRLPLPGRSAGRAGLPLPRRALLSQARRVTPGGSLHRTARRNRPCRG